MTEIIRHEILQVAETVAREKGILKEEVLEAMEQALQKVARTKYGLENDIQAIVDRQTGQISLSRCREVVDEVTHSHTQIALADAKKKDSSLEVGSVLSEPLPPIDFGRVAAQTAKQVVYQRVREAERISQHNEFKDRIGEVISGVVKRVEFGNVLIDLGKAEGFLRRDDLLPRESFRVGDRVRACIRDVRRETRGPQIFLSRTVPKFMERLFTQEVPEIYDGVIDIKAVARDPGSRAKMAVYSKDSSIDPVGSCVGMRGSRVQAVVQELQGEKVDIIPWSPDIATFVVNALAPAEVSKVVMGDEPHRIEVVVPDDQLSLAIGRRGQNVRLACELTGMSIDILTEGQESLRRTTDVNMRTQLFMEALDVDDVISHLLVGEGFETVEEVAYVALHELTNLEGFTDELSHELQTRARSYLGNASEEMMRAYKAFGGTDELAALPELTPKLLVELAEKGIKTRDDLAELSSDDLRDLISQTKLTQEQANQVIIAARAHWFDDQS